MQAEDKQVRAKEEHADIAAVSAGVVAVAMSLFAIPGRYDTMDLVVSVTLFLVFAAFVWPQRRDPLRSRAVAAAGALALIPAIGFFDELARAGGRWHPMLGAGGGVSRVPDTDLAIGWLVAALLVYLADRRQQQHR
jgi:hypothetical protein